MFSTLTDRFFHGMNKKNTKMIHTANIKASLNSDRSRRSSQSKSKITRMFDTNQSTMRSSLNKTMKTPTSADGFQLNRDSFLPPPPIKQNQMVNRHRNAYSKTSSQFAPSISIQQLQFMVQKNDEENNEIGSKKGQMKLMSTLSIKDKLRQNIQRNAIKRFLDIQYLHNTNTKKQKVDDQNIKKMLQILNNKNKNQSPTQREDFNHRQVPELLSGGNDEEQHFNDSFDQDSQNQMVKKNDDPTFGYQRNNQFYNSTNNRQSLNLIENKQELIVQMPKKLPQKQDLIKNDKQKIFPTNIQPPPNLKIELPQRNQRVIREKQIRQSKEQQKRTKDKEQRTQMIKPTIEKIEQKKNPQIVAKIQGSNKNIEKIKLTEPSIQINKNQEVEKQKMKEKEKQKEKEKEKEKQKQKQKLKQKYKQKQREKQREKQKEKQKQKQKQKQKEKQKVKQIEKAKVVENKNKKTIESQKLLQQNKKKEVIGKGDNKNKEDKKQEIQEVKQPIKPKTQQRVQLYDQFSSIQQIELVQKQVIKQKATTQTVIKNQIKKAEPEKPRPIQSLSKTAKQPVKNKNATEEKQVIQQKKEQKKSQKKEQKIMKLDDQQKKQEGRTKQSNKNIANDASQTKNKNNNAQIGNPQNKNKVNEKVKQKFYDLQETIQEIEHYLTLIDEVGHFSKITKKFYQKNKLQVFNQEYKTSCFYLWAQMCYLRQRCIKIMTQKDEKLYDVQQWILNEPDLEEFLEVQTSRLQDQSQQCVNKLQAYHKNAKNSLSQQQKTLRKDNRIDFNSRCLSILHQQFKQIQKVYKKSVKISDPNAQTYAHRLCLILQIFCLLKYLSKGEQIKQYTPQEEIKDMSTHYQNYKHLIVL